MDAQTYSQKRDELVLLLQQTLDAISVLPAKYQTVKDLPELSTCQQELGAICKRVYEDQFKIVLVAHFQGGKSTTCNALADGMVISPMGNGALTCSASCIRVQNVLDASQVGAEIELHSAAELSRLCADLIGQPVDLTDESSRGAALASYAKVRQEWFGNKQKVTHEHRDLVLLVGLILQFYDAPEVVRLRELVGQKLGLAQVAALVRFPPDFTSRYGAEARSDFKASEVLFPFIRRVVCRIQSANLGSIGAAVSDCPGLFANSSDTNTALGEIAESDAVWYLLDAKAVGESDQKAIKACRDICGDRLFFTANIKENRLAKPRIISGEVFREIRSGIRKAGLDDFQDQDLHPYHALLALLAMQGPKLLEGNLDAMSAQALIAQCTDWDLQVATPAQAWEAITTWCLQRLYPPMGVPAFNGLARKLSPEGIALVRQESGLDEILSAIHGYVIKKKAGSILIDNGAQKAARLLNDSIENRLRNREESAMNDVERARKIWEEAKALLDEFAALAREEVEGLQRIGDHIDRTIAEDFYEKVYLDNVEMIAAEAAAPLAERLGLVDMIWDAGLDLWDWLWSNPRSASHTNEQISFLLQAIIEDATKPIGVAWFEQLNRGQNELFQKEVVEESTRIQKKIQKQWEQTKQRWKEIKQLRDEDDRSQFDMFDSLPAPTLGLGQLVSIESIRSSVNFGNDALSTKAIDTALEGGAVFTLGTIAALFLGPVGAVAVSAIWVICRDNSSFEAKIKDKVAKSLRDAFNSTRAVAVSKAQSEFSGLRLAYTNVMQEAITRMQEAFDIDMRQAFEDFNKAEAERKVIALECAEIRKDHIAPLGERLEKFVEETAPLCES